MTNQPTPTTTASSEAVFPALYASLLDSGRGALGPDLLARRRKGIATYGTELMTHNGRNATQDKYEELLDALVYHVQENLEAGKAIMDDEFWTLRDLAMDAKKKLEAQGNG